MNIKRIAFVWVALLISVQCIVLHAQISSEKARIVVVTDLGGQDPGSNAAFDPDDTQSMVHLLVCSNMVDIEGIVSAMAWTTEPNRTKYIHRLVEQFAEVLPNLHRQASGYPTIDHIRSIVKQGPLVAHMDGVGEGKDTPGSDWIISVVDRDDPRPVWLTTWAGMSPIAQALWKVRNSRSSEEVKKFIRKVRIYDVLGQDDCGAWVAKNFPDILYIRNTKVYGWTPEDAWFQRNVQARKPFGEHYPTRIWSWEGDTPGFLYFLANGLNVPEHPEYGGWGGRFNTRKVSGVRGMGQAFGNRTGKNETRFDPYYMIASAPEGVEAVKRWAPEMLNDFAARMLWTTTGDFSAVNHHPVPVLDGDKSLQCVFKTVQPGGTLNFDASESTDPDGDRLSYSWSIYKEAGNYQGDVTVEGSFSSRCKIRIPTDASGRAIHLILKVTDNGTPALTLYRRVVLEVSGEAVGPITKTRVTQGEVEGIEKNGMGYFYAVPYGQPPVGDLRWREPQAAKVWEGTFKATEPGPMAPQAIRSRPGQESPKTSENILYSNIITPAVKPDEGLPVMVWIHGGGFITGDASSPAGDNFARSGIVYVAINYRIGALGFLSLPELTAESRNHSSGNYGLLDMILALKWVKDNISAFGGDPNKVTIIGESAGAIAVSMLCASPLAKGLFRGAISESGGSFCPVDSIRLNNNGIRDLAGSEKFGQDFMYRMGANSLEEIRAMSPDNWIHDVRTTGVGGFWPNVDGYVITDDRYKLYQKGEYNDVNVLIGTNSDEGSMFVRSTTVADYQKAIRDEYGPFADRMLELYPATDDEQSFAALSDIFRETAFAWPSWVWADLQGRTGKGRVYLYYFDQFQENNPFMRGRIARGAGHASEMAYVFGNLRGELQKGIDRFPNVCSGTGSTS